MAEFEEKLNAILGNPGAMDQIVSIAKALTGETEDAAPPQEPPTRREQPSPEHKDAPPEDWSALLGLLGGGDGGNPLSALGELDPQLIRTAIALFSEYSATDDRKAALLNALRPFLKEARREKIDKAVRIARLARVIRVALQLFRGKNQDEVTGDV